MKWFQILKNIQIGSQKTGSKNYVKPDEPEEDCFEWFKQLYYLMQGEEIIEPDMDIQPFREYTNEKLWCPLKKGIKFSRTTMMRQPGVQTLNFKSTVLLSGEKVTFTLWVDVPEPSSRFGDDNSYNMYFSLDSTARERIDVEFFQMAQTRKPTKYDLYGGTRRIQFENYKKIAVKVVNYMKEAMG